MDITEKKKIELELINEKEKAKEKEFFLQESQRAGNIGSYKMEIKSGYWISTETLDQILGIDDSYKKNVEGWLNIVHPEEREKMQDYLLNEVFAKNQPFDCDYRIIRLNDNSVRWLHGFGNLYYNQDGDLISMQGTIQDITERKFIEDERQRINSELESRVMERTAQLNKANKDLESFAYSVSHDLRAPVRHIGGFVELLSNLIKPLDDKAQGYFDKINTSVKGMSVMIDELLSFSRLGRAELHYSDVDLNSIIDTILSQSKLDYIEREIEWKINKLPIVKGDPTLLKIVLENLISNAIKYTSKKERAIIEIGELNPGLHFVTMYVKDNGVGFDMMYKDKLFKVFQRLHKKEDFEGIGIGLANVEQIIKKHNGTIDVESEVNKGTTFFITLPL